MRVIGSIGMCNTASLNIYEVDANEEIIVAGLNNDKPRRYKLYNNTKGTYFNWGGSRQYLHEIIDLRKI